MKKVEESKRKEGGGGGGGRSKTFSSDRSIDRVFISSFLIKYGEEAAEMVVERVKSKSQFPKK